MIENLYLKFLTKKVKEINEKISLTEKSINKKIKEEKRQKNNK